MAMEVDAADEGYLEKAAASAPSELRPFYSKARELHDKKLWYQLTVAVEAFLTTRPAQRAPCVPTCIITLSAPHQENQSAAARGNRSRRLEAIPRSVDSAQILDDVAEKVDTVTTQEAFVFAIMEAAHFKAPAGRLGRDKGSHGQMWQDSRRLRQRRDQGSCQLLPRERRLLQDQGRVCVVLQELAFVPCLRQHRDRPGSRRSGSKGPRFGYFGLLGDTIYNFGELLLHPILASLDASAHAWLSTLLFSFNSGDLGRFESLIPHLSSEPILAENQPFLRQKICLMALIESVFRRASTDRTLSFETIAVETRLPRDEVEHLVMKALSLKLIKGTLDQHAQLARITWVQPRVLDKRQIEALQARLNAWCDRVEEVTKFVQGETRELLSLGIASSSRLTLTLVIANNS
ncbi:hypothetical protein L7F22_042515 [Adiantum nelumboides]|nr:hypothetical protein [Adiantum nelumboides]